MTTLPDTITVPTETIMNVVLVALNEVRAAERELEKHAEWLQSKLKDIQNITTQGRTPNSLGELQSTGYGTDVAVARLSQARRGLASMLPLLATLIEADPEADDLRYFREGLFHCPSAMEVFTDRGAPEPVRLMALMLWAEKQAKADA